MYKSIQGTSRIIGKYGSNNGFDVVAYRGTLDNPTEIIIIEAKQFRQGRQLAEFDGIEAFVGYDRASGLVLNQPNPNTGLPTQMSREWAFEHVVGELFERGGDYRRLSNAIERNRDVVERYIFAIDKSDGSGHFLKLSNNF
jgi:hypothetical protein